MPQDWFNLIPKPKQPYEGPIRPLDNTPLEETNPWLAQGRDFLRNFTGIGEDRGVLSPDGQESAGGLIGDALGVLNPEKMMLAPIAGMTKFLKINRVGNEIVRTPDVARRVAQTNDRLQDLYATLSRSGASPDDIAKTMEIAQKYPRTLAHTDEITNIDPRGPNPGAAGVSRAHKLKTLQNIELNRNPQIVRDTNRTVNYGRHGIEIPREQETPFAQTFAHELQHVGQALPNVAKMVDRYNTAQRTVGYRNNPYETSAIIGSIKRAYGHLPEIAQRFGRRVSGQ